MKKMGASSWLVRVLAGIVVLGTAAASLTGCISASGQQSSVTVTSSGLVDSGVDAALESFYGQSVTLSTCSSNSGFQCGTVTVPMDYSNPSGETVTLAVNVHRATNASKGVLLFNPGGPGGSGYDYTLTYLNYLFSSDLIANYDIVGFDPRGVGKSTAVKCFDSDAAKDAFIYGVVEGTPGSAEYVAASNAKFAQLGQDCERLSGDLLAHVDTESSARDLDVLRAVFGSSTLNYFGFSYGTFLGAEYADLFPTRVGKFVFDGAENPALNVTDLSYGQMQGFDGAIRAYIANCLSESSCPLSGTADSAADQLTTLVSSLQDSPLTNSDGRVLGTANMLQVVVDCMYNSNYWSKLSTVISDVQSGKASSAFSLLDTFNSRNSDGSYADNSTEAFYAVMCLDYPRRNSATEIAEDQARYLAGSSILGQFWADGTAMCNGWPVDAVRTPAAVSAVGSGPILIVDTTGDPATPYPWGLSLSTQLVNSRLLTVDGYQHTAYSSSASSCVVSAVDDFLLNGTLPDVGSTCQAT